MNIVVLVGAGKCEYKFKIEAIPMPDTRAVLFYISRLQVYSVFAFLVFLSTYLLFHILNFFVGSLILKDSKRVQEYLAQYMWIWTILLGSTSRLKKNCHICSPHL